MKISYFEDTDTLYIDFLAGDVAETRDLDENTVLDLDASGYICAMTFEHASQRTDVKHLVVEGIAASISEPPVPGPHVTSVSDRCPRRHRVWPTRASGGEKVG